MCNQNRQIKRFTNVWYRGRHTSYVFLKQLIWVLRIVWKKHSHNFALIESGQSIKQKILGSVNNHYQFFMQIFISNQNIMFKTCVKWSNVLFYKGLLSLKLSISLCSATVVARIATGAFLCKWTSKELFSVKLGPNHLSACKIQKKQYRYFNLSASAVL